MAKLTIREDGGKERVFEHRGDEISIGRAPDNVLVLDVAGVSRNHAIIKIGEKGAVVFDLESKNGTKVNGLAVQNAKLKDGDEIRIGRVQILFSNAAPGEGPGPQVGESAATPLPLEEKRPTALAPAASGTEAGDSAWMRGNRPPRVERSDEPRLQAKAPFPAPVEAASPFVAVSPPGRLESAAAGAEGLSIVSDSARKPAESPTSGTRGSGAEGLSSGTRGSGAEGRPIPDARGSPADNAERSAQVERFYLVDQGKPRVFAREALAGAVPLADLLGDSADVVPWDELFRLEGTSPLAPYDTPRGAILFAQGPEGGIILLDTAAVVTVVEAPDDKSVKGIPGRAIQLAAAMATEWTAATLQKEFEGRHAGQAFADHIRQKLGKAPTAGFLKSVEANLQAGKVRLLFAVRERTGAIQKVVDFVSGKTSMSASVLQVEVYRERAGPGEKSRLAVEPRVFGPARVPAKAPPTAQPEASAAFDIVSPK